MREYYTNTDSSHDVVAKAAREDNNKHKTTTTTNVPGALKYGPNTPPKGKNPEGNISHTAVAATGVLSRPVAVPKGQKQCCG